MGAHLRDHQVRQLLKELLINRRHYHTSNYFLFQTYKSEEPDNRRVFRNMFFVRVLKKEMQDIMNEI